MLKPLGLPPGSVRALLLLGLAARAILDLRAAGQVPNWLIASLVICAAAYFSARAANAHRRAMEPGESHRARPPLGLPAGTVRLLFLVAVGYGTWVFLKGREVDIADFPVAWILGAFFLGVLVRLALKKAHKPADAGTHWGWHLQALTVLLAVAGLVVLSVLGQPDKLPTWVEPVLAAGPVYYFATR